MLAIICLPRQKVLRNAGVRYCACSGMQGTVLGNAGIRHCAQECRALCSGMQGTVLRNAGMRHCAQDCRHCAQECRHEAMCSKKTGILASSRMYPQESAAAWPAATTAELAYCVSHCHASCALHMESLTVRKECMGRPNKMRLVRTFYSAWTVLEM
eukprot:1157334-Pelagomonas_calceolata.AAC.10